MLYTLWFWLVFEECHVICNQPVSGSSPFTSSIFSPKTQLVCWLFIKTTDYKSIFAEHFPVHFPKFSLFNDQFRILSCFIYQQFFYYNFNQRSANALKSQYVNWSIISLPKFVIYYMPFHFLLILLIFTTDHQKSLLILK